MTVSGKLLALAGSVLALGVAMPVSSAFARHGADDRAGHVRHGGDDGPRHVRHGDDDGPRHR